MPRTQLVIQEVLHESAERAVPTADLWPEIRGRIRTGRRSLLIRAGVAAALTVAIVLAGLPLLDRSGSSADAAALLNDLAAVAASQPGAPAFTQGYRYTREQNMYIYATGGFQFLVPKTRETWIGADGSGRIKETAGDRVFLSERDRAAWIAAGSPSLGREIDQDFGPGELFAEDFSALPPDVAGLRAEVRRRAEETDVPVDVEMFIVVGDLLRQQVAPPEIRAALYRVAAGIPGVELIGEVRDRTGRPGVAVAKTTDYWGARERLVLIFDPKTSALLAEERVLLSKTDWSDAEPPVVVSYAVYLNSEVVDRLPD